MVQVDASNNHACTKVEDATPRRLDGAQRGDVEVVKEWVPASTQTTRKSDLDLWTSWNPSLVSSILLTYGSHAQLMLTARVDYEEPILRETPSRVIGGPAHLGSAWQ
jgi:hypothetical protein